MSGEVMSILLLLIIHMIAMPALYLLCGRELLQTFRQSSDDDDDDGGLPPTDDPAEKPSPGGGGLPLPDAAQSPVRLREPGRIGDAKTRPARRPEHEPQRTPQRV
jgi:hypothetical protein